MYFKMGGSWNTIHLMALVHSLEVHDSVPEPTHKNDYLIDENQAEEKIKYSLTFVR